MLSKKLHLISLGCTKNLVDSEVMLGRLSDYEMTDSPELADVIIINTCGFIQSAKEESIQTILQASERKKNGALLVASGCLSQRYKDELQKLIPEIDIITGVGDYDKIDRMLEQKSPQISERVFLADEASRRVITGSRIHAYIKISEGCNQNCSFCAIPSFKGRLQSRSIDSILKEIQILSEQGFCDFTFIAQDSSSYLYDHKQKDGLIALIDAIEKQNLAKSARILYLYPSSTTLELIEKIADSKIFQNYFDMPIQHISEAMLKKMRRGSSKAQHIELLNAMRAVPGSFVRSTLIVGHPQESEQDFEELCAFLQDFRFDRLNIFAFSSEEGTIAQKLDGKIPTSIINKRLSTLNKIILTQQKHLYKQMLSQAYPIILEGKSEMSEYFYSARDIRWAPEVDGEILINDSELENLTLESGYYEAVLSDVKDKLLFGKVTKKLQC
ncbi:30S ribosomal protein S12 methylthiotransferase RimO [Helicobacter sp. 11S02596-1]|uniref:30S ribosomal protein S12 methylthiotransferase RimO n=1 Tax=Helicobacter sp. 11S02596-1 TaxID=1476194 RepID=UPI000BA74E9D|nr:30S ribosomal protein S12 methylthiotransferase RimO [Helicobacter sp. 11S02596-1]PAF44879.1 ribosomal protein S12 methylthiotransferase RimO [Helicobacter sp. 11S02596-1]